MLVEDVMTLDPPTCSRAQPLVAAGRRLRALDIAAMPVVDSRDRLVGVLSVDDLARWEERRDTSRRWARYLQNPALVAHAMTHEVIVVRSGESITSAARTMRYVGRYAVPVLDFDGRLVGVVSVRDIATASTRTDASIQCEVDVRLAEFVGDERSGSVVAHVDDGIVTLIGTAESNRELASLRRVAAAVTGVAGVKDNIFIHVPADLV